MERIREAKIILEFEEGLEFDEVSTYEEALEHILESLEDADVKIKVISEDGVKAEFEEDGYEEDDEEDDEDED